MRVLALSSSVKPEGFDGAFYYTPEAQTENVQLILSQTGEEANWKLCTDAIVHKAQGQATVPSPPLTPPPPPPLQAWRPLWLVWECVCVLFIY